MNGWRFVWGMVCALSLLGAGCGDDNVRFVQADDPVAHFGDRCFSVPSDCLYIGECGMERLCGIAASGEPRVVFQPDAQELPVLPGGEPVQIYIGFHPTDVPRPEDVTGEGPAASIRAYAAPYVTDNPDPLLPQPEHCCAEDSEENRLATRIEFDPAGHLLIKTLDAVSGPTQFALVLDYQRLFPDRLSFWDPKSDLGFVNISAFVVRTYVDAKPSISR